MSKGVIFFINSHCSDDFEKKIVKSCHCWSCLLDKHKKSQYVLKMSLKHDTNNWFKVSIAIWVGTRKKRDQKLFFGSLSYDYMWCLFMMHVFVSLKYICWTLNDTTDFTLDPELVRGCWQSSSAAPAAAPAAESPRREILMYREATKKYFFPLRQYTPRAYWSHFLGGGF